MSLQGDRGASSGFGDWNLPGDRIIDDIPLTEMLKTGVLIVRNFQALYQLEGSVVEELIFNFMNWDKTKKIFICWAISVIYLVGLGLVASSTSS